MWDTIKNPIVLAITVGVIVFIFMMYYNGEFDKKKKKQNKEKKKNNAGDSKETSLIVAVIAGIGTWFLSNYCFDKSSKDSEDYSSDVELELNSIKGGNKIIKNKGIPSISSEEQTRSYNLLGSGLNIPKSELRIPDVLIDYE